MSFLTLEKAGGKPVELYVFQRLTSYWRYTDGRSGIVVNSLTYLPAVISRTAQTDSQEESQSTLTVTLDRSLPVVAGMLMGSGGGYIPSTLTIYRYQPGATDKACIAHGRISSVRWLKGRVEITLLQTANLLQQLTPRLTFITTCNHVVYDDYCQANAANFTFGGSIAAIYATGAVGGSPDGPSVAVNIAANPTQFNQAGYFAAGYFNADGAGDLRFITSHTIVSGNAILVSMTALPASLIVGASILFTAGCDGSIGTCAAKFANVKNFLGFPYMPSKNPFTRGFN